MGSLLNASPARNAPIAKEEPSVAYLGPRSAGHYVKMVHNGIEYGLMQLIAETYDLMKRGLGLEDEKIAEAFDLWNSKELAGYLVEITARIFRREDPRTDNYLIDVILDEARQKGTGMWTSQDAMEMQVPVPTIDTAVAMRHLSAMKEEREEASRAANCYDNAFMESCFGTVKTELEMEPYKNPYIARKEVPDYIRYSNTRRRHSALGYLTPEAFEARMPC